MAKKYRVNPIALWQNPRMSTQIKGVPVSLCDEDLVVERPGQAGQPPLRLSAKKATQEQLKWLKEQGNPLIEEYEEGDDILEVVSEKKAAKPETAQVAASNK